MNQGAWPDPDRHPGRARQGLALRSRLLSDEGRRRLRIFFSTLRAVGWPSLLVVGLALPDRLESPRAMILASALSLFVFERLERARAKRLADDLAAFARAMDAEDALASSLFVLSSTSYPSMPSIADVAPTPSLPPRPLRWRPRASRVPPRPAWPSLPTARPPTKPALLPFSQRPTVPDEERTHEVERVERVR